MANISTSCGVNQTQTANHAQSIALGVYLIPLSVFGIAGSSLGLYLISRKRKKAFISANLLLVSLCVTSLIFSALVAPLQAYASVTGYPNLLSDHTHQSKFGCSLVAFLYLLIFQASPFVHASIAINRLLVIALSHIAVLQSRTLSLFLVFFPWVAAAFLSIWPSFGIGGEYGYSCTVNRCVISKSNSFVYHMATRIASPFLCFGIMTVCYAAIFFKLHYSQRFQEFGTAKHTSNIVEPKVKSTFPAAKVDNHNVKILREREVHVTRISFCTCVSFMLLYLPIAIHGLTATDSRALQGGVAANITVLSWAGFALSPWMTMCLDSAARSRKVHECRSHCLSK